jgi:hypothetical protein
MMADVVKSLIIAVVNFQKTQLFLNVQLLTINKIMVFKVDAK